MELELESRVLGDIDYHSDNPDNFQNFFDFTIEEVKNRYFDFLNLSTEGEDNHEGYDVDNGETGHDTHDSQEYYSQHINKDIENNLNHEYDQMKNNSIEEAFTDFNYWKPQVDYNLEQLLTEMSFKN